ncbi:YfjI family protein [Salmonella enterica subsp. enterica]
MSLPNDYPIDAYPEIIRNTIYEVSNITKAPLPLIGASILGGISLASQNLIDVLRPGGLRGPASIFLLTIAESGERKSTIDSLLLSPVRQFESQLFESYTQDLVHYRSNLEIINIEKKALLEKIRSGIRNNQDTSEAKEQLNKILLSIPKAPTRYRLIFNDATSAAIKDYLSGEWNSIGIMSDEAGTIFDGYTLNELPFINKMWDGATFSVDRKNMPDTIIKDARLTLSLMIQPDVFKKYLERKGNMAKGVGFFARCLICKPYSTQGSRHITNPVISTEHLPIFQNRLMEIVHESINKYSSCARICLKFSHSAELLWLEFYNQIETAMGLAGSLSNFKDYASKIAENTARIAALLHYFNGNDGDISPSSLESASRIIIWYADEYVRLFSKPQEIILANSDADELYYWIRSLCQKNNYPIIRKNTILQYGPNRFRNRSKLDELLFILQSKNRIIMERRGKVTLIQYIEIPSGLKL